MKRFMIYVLAIILCKHSALAENKISSTQTSKRIEVYSISQSFWDVSPGETLGEIVTQLLPDNIPMRSQLLKQIVQLNPDAFSHSNPDNLKANVRLWLPNYASSMRSDIDKNKYEIKSFSWGQVYSPKRH